MCLRCVTPPNRRQSNPLQNWIPGTDHRRFRPTGRRLGQTRPGTIWIPAGAMSHIQTLSAAGHYEGPCIKEGTPPEAVSDIIKVCDKLCFILEGEKQKQRFADDADKAVGWLRREIMPGLGSFVTQATQIHWETAVAAFKVSLNLARVFASDAEGRDIPSAIGQVSITTQCSVVIRDCVGRVCWQVRWSIARSAFHIFNLGHLCA